MGRGDPYCLRPPGSHPWNTGLRAAARPPLHRPRQPRLQALRLQGIFTAILQGRDRHDCTGEEKGSERSEHPAKLAARSPTPDTSLSPCWSLSRVAGCPAPGEPGMAGPQLGASPAPPAVNPTAAAANATEQRALPPACLYFMKGPHRPGRTPGRLQAKMGSTPWSSSYRKPSPPTGPSVDSSGLRVLSCDMGAK